MRNILFSCLLLSCLNVFAYHAPNTGRFLSRDPIGEDGGKNLYAIVNNNTVNAWDYLGLTWDPDSRYVSLSEMPYKGKRGHLGYTSMGAGLVYKNEDIIEESENKCCATIKSAKDRVYSSTSLIGKESELVGIKVTKNFYSWLIGHEARRLVCHKNAYDTFVEPAINKGSAVTACGKLCLDKKGAAKQKLQKYLKDLRAASEEQARKYVSKCMAVITKENNTWKRNSAGLWDTAKKIQNSASR
jgi:uncharacterized protein RhaS with RHS repeats